MIARSRDEFLWCKGEKNTIASIYTRIIVIIGKKLFRLGRDLWPYYSLNAVDAGQEKKETHSFRLQSESSALPTGSVAVMAWSMRKDLDGILPPMYLRGSGSVWSLGRSCCCCTPAHRKFSRFVYKFSLTNSTGNFSRVFQWESFLK